MPAVKLTWYDGGFNPPKPEEIGDERLNGEGGILYVGTKGKMLQDTYGNNPRLLPKSLHDSYGAPKQKLARITQQEHEMNWVEAIKGKAEISSPFEYAVAARRGHAAWRGRFARRREDPRTTPRTAASRTW